MPEVTGYQTAISRKTPPEPIRWLNKQGLLKGRVLDYGSGRNCWLGMICYDPHWRPSKPRGKFDTVVCCYVLNVVTPAAQTQIIRAIHGYLKAGGHAYFAVRRDIPKSGKEGRGTFQRYVVLPTTSISKTGTREIYRMGRLV